MGLKLLQITGTFLTTIWTVPMARSAVSAGLAFQATFARSTGFPKRPFMPALPAWFEYGSTSKIAFWLGCTKA